MAELPTGHYLAFPVGTPPLVVGPFATDVALNYYIAAEHIYLPNSIHYIFTAELRIGLDGPGS